MNKFMLKPGIMVDIPYGAVNNQKTLVAKFMRRGNFLFIKTRIKFFVIFAIMGLSVIIRRNEAKI